MNAVSLQIQPVENGFVIQAVNLDGDRLSKRLVSTSREDVIAQVKSLADLMFTQEPKSNRPQQVQIAPTTVEAAPEV